MSFDLSNYVDVRARIEMFREKYPQGSLQPADPANPFRIVQVGDRIFVAYVAAAYRTADDTRPGIGVAWEPIPGRTPYTKDSELMNAETSAWGRAIVAVLAVDRGASIASAEEIRNRENAPAPIVQMVQPSRPAPTPQQHQRASASSPAATAKQMGFMRSLATRLELGDAELAGIVGCDLDATTVAQAKRAIDLLLSATKGEAAVVFGDDGTVSIVPNDGA